MDFQPLLSQWLFSHYMTLFGNNNFGDNIEKASTKKRTSNFGRYINWATKRSARCRRWDDCRTVSRKKVRAQASSRYLCCSNAFHLLCKRL